MRFCIVVVNTQQKIEIKNIFNVSVMPWKVRIKGEGCEKKKPAPKIARTMDFVVFRRLKKMKIPLPNHIKNWVNHTTLSALPAKSVRAIPSSSGYSHGRC